MRAILPAIILALIGLVSGWRWVVARRRRTIYMTPRILHPEESFPELGDCPAVPHGMPKGDR